MSANTCCILENIYIAYKPCLDSDTRLMKLKHSFRRENTDPDTKHMI